MTRKDSRTNLLHQVLRDRGFKRDRAITRAHRFKGWLTADERKISVAIAFRDLEFTCLPELTLLDPDREALEVVSHLNASGALCFGRNEDVVLDRYDVDGSVLVCLELARRGLEHALSQLNSEQEISQEFPQHWLGKSFYFDLFEKRHSSANTYLVPGIHQSGRLVLADRNDPITRLCDSRVDFDRAMASSKPVFVFYAERDLSFAQGYRTPNDLAEFIGWLDYILPNSRKRAFSELTKYFPSQTFSGLFVHAPNGCVGMLADMSHANVRSAKTLPGLRRIVGGKTARAISIERLSGIGINLPFVFRRNLHKHRDLRGCQIVLIGCGTIGSHLAKFLVQTGLGHGGGKLLLVDNQLFGPGNIGRHYLGTPSIGEFKSEALKRELVKQFPEAEVMAVKNNALAILEGLIGYDLVIDATGEEALSMAINHHFVDRRSMGEIPAVLFVRLFGNGAAGQVLLVDGADYACFKCLKPRHAENWRFSPLKSGIVPIQSAAACGEGQYIAYGVAAPAMVASLAFQVVLDWNSKVPSPRLRTVRVERNDTISIEDTDPARSPSCPACGV